MKRLLLLVLLAILGTASIAHANHGVLFWRGDITQSNIGTTTTYLHAAEGLMVNREFAVPIAGKADDMTVTCTSNVARDTVFTLLVDGSASALTCTVATGAATCNDWDIAHAVTVSAAQRMTVSVTGTGAVSSACFVTASWFTTAFGAADALLAWGGIGSATPNNGEYCGPSGALTGNQRKCRGTSAEQASFIVPASGTLTGICASLSSAVSGSNTEIYTVRDVTAATDYGLSVTLANADGRAKCSTVCTGDCSVTAGHLLVVRYNRTGTGDGRERNLTLSFSGMGTLGSDRYSQLWNTGEQWGNRLYAFSTSGSGLTTYRMDRAGAIQNLRAQIASASPTNDMTITICSGSTAPPTCTGTRPSCIIHSGGETSCADTTNFLDLAAGDYFTVKASAPGFNGSALPGMTFEIVDSGGGGAEATNTFTPTITLTPTITRTPTPTRTPTIANCIGGQAGLVADVATVGEVAWSDPGFGNSSDNTYATFSTSGDGFSSHYLWANNFNLTVPLGKVVTGIFASVELKASVAIPPTNYMLSSSVRLVVDDAVCGSNRGSSTYWPGVDTLRAYGTPIDLWGCPPTNDQVNSPLFGFALVATNVGTTGKIGSVDHMELTVCYADPTSTPTSTSTPTITQTFTGTPQTPTNTPTPTDTRTPTITNTPTNTAVNTSTPLPTNTGGPDCPGTLVTSTHCGTATNADNPLSTYPIYGWYGLPLICDSDVDSAAYTFWDLGTVGISDFIDLKDYFDGSELPSYGASAPVIGIQVTGTRGRTDTISVHDDTFKLLLAGGGVGTYNKATATVWCGTPTSEPCEVFQYGSLADTWGQTLTASDIFGPGFGVRIGVENTLGSENAAIAPVGNVSIALCIAANTPTKTPTSTKTPTVTPTANPIRCGGDCNNDGEVTIGELQTVLDIFNGTAPLSDCPNADSNADDMVTIGDVQTAQNNFNNGCSSTSPTPTPMETFTPLPASVCPGDCDGNGSTSIGELQTCNNIFLGTSPVSDCFAADRDNDGTVSIGELQACSDGFNGVVGCTTPTPTPSITKTPTVTRTHTATVTPTIFGCQQIAVTGPIYDGAGNLAAERRVNVRVPYTEVVNAGCTLHPNLIVYMTTALGEMPVNASVVGGSVINVSLENGGPTQVTVPRNITTITITDLLNQ